MQKLHLSDIRIPENRQRQEFEPEALQELVNSIEKLGLMHPPVVRQVGPSGIWTLVAGERRLRAITQLSELGFSFTHAQVEFKDGYLPATDIGELSELDAEEAELDENLKRKDLTWQEHAAAVSRLHRLRQGQQEVRLEEANDSNELDGLDASQIAEAFPKHSVEATAQEVYGDGRGFYQEAIRQKLIVAQHLDNPAIAKAKSSKEAFKILRQQEEREKNEELAKIVGKTFSVDSHRLFNVNCLDWMADPANKEYFDIILTDPPYGMDAQDFGDAAGRLSGIEHHYDDSYEGWQKLMKAWTVLSFQVAKPQAHAYVFCDIDRFHELKLLMEAAGWYVFRTPLINVKSNSGRVPLPEHGPRRQYEILLFALKGKKRVNFIYPDVITTSADKNLSHGAQKPVELYENLLLRSARPGDKVLDAFAGSGTIYPAAHTYQCEATGLEQSAEYYALCVQRLEAMKKADEQLEMFSE